jgi:type III secretion protein Q
MIAISKEISGVLGKKINTPLLKKISNESVFHLRNIFTRRIPIVCNSASSSWKITHSNINSFRPQQKQLVFDWGGASCVFRLNHSSYENFVCDVLGIDYVPSFNDEVSSALFEIAISDFINVFQKSTRKRFVLISSGFGNLPDWALYGAMISFDNGASETHVECWTDDIGIGFFSIAVKEVEKCEDFPEFLNYVPVYINFRAGYTSVPLSLIRTIEKHDVIVFDENFISDGGSIAVLISKSHGFSGKLEGSTIVVSEEIKKIMRDDAEMSDDDDVTSIDDLEIRLDFDLGERTVSLSELRLISPGYVFDLGRDLRKSVVIKANGKAIGHGELVDIDGISGVSVLSFNGNSN